eukprot:4459766-Pyramimonas_sp.AAC.1
MQIVSIAKYRVGEAWSNPLFYDKTRKRGQPADRIRTDDYLPLKMCDKTVGVMEDHAMYLKGWTETDGRPFNLVMTEQDIAPR